MVELVPFELFMGILVLLIAVPLISFMLKTKLYSSVAFFVCGAIIVMLGVSVSSIDMGSIPDTSITAGATTTYTFRPDPFYLHDPVTDEPNIFSISLILLGIMLLSSGVLIEKYA